MEKEKAGGCFLASGMEARTRVRVWGGEDLVYGQVARQTTQYLSKKRFGGLVEVCE